jgi:hypothetical protein
VAVAALIAIGLYLHHRQKVLLAKAHLDSNAILDDPTKNAVSEEPRTNQTNHRDPKLAEGNT